MIEDRFEKIEAKVHTTRDIPETTKTELLQLLSGLKAEIAELSKTHIDEAQSIAGFAEASAHEATRNTKRPDLIGTAVKGLTGSVEGFEASHPMLVQVVNRLSTILSNMGI